MVNPIMYEFLPYIVKTLPVYNFIWIYRYLNLCIKSHFVEDFSELQTACMMPKKYINLYIEYNKKNK